MLLDISQPVTSDSAHFPGDEPFSCGWTLRLEDGASVNLSWVKSSPHVGTHVDAPFHYAPDGRRVGELPLDAFVGPAIVVDAVGRHALDADLLDGLDLAASPRVLFRTRERTDPYAFDPDFPVLTEAAIERLVQARVRLVGVDVASVDAADSKTLSIHHALGRSGIVNLENLRLDEAAPGAYELIALPARWHDLDAAPVRAVLRR